AALVRYTEQRVSISGTAAQRELTAAEAAELSGMVIEWLRGKVPSSVEDSLRQLVTASEAEGSKLSAGALSEIEELLTKVPGWNRPLWKKIVRNPIVVWFSLGRFSIRYHLGWGPWA